MKYNIENRSGLYVNGVAYPSGLWSGGGYITEYIDPVVNITRFPYDEIDTVIYDGSNIFIHFNNLIDTSTDSNVLVATDYDGIGVADDVTGTDLIGLSNISTEFEFSNISDDESTADTLVTSSPIQDGDNLVIVKEDGSVHELVASGVVESTIIADGSTNTSTDYTQFTEDLIAYYGTNATNSQKILFNPSTYSGGVAGFYAPYYFTGELGTPKIINKYRIDQSVAGVQKMIGGWKIEGSHDNSNWDTLDSKSPGWHGAAAYNGLWISFVNATAYKYYRVHVTNSNYVRRKNNAGIGFCRMIQADGEPTSMDTSVVTQGEIPSRVYAVDAKTSFAISGGYVDAIKNADSYSVGAVDVLSTTRTYVMLEDATGSNTVSPKVTLKSTGDKMTKMKFTTLKENT